MAGRHRLHRRRLHYLRRRWLCRMACRVGMTHVMYRLGLWLRVLVAQTIPHLTHGPTLRDAIGIDENLLSVRAVGRGCTRLLGVVSTGEARSLCGWQACPSILFNVTPTLRTDMLP